MSKDAVDAKIIEEQLAPFKPYGEEVKYQNWLEMTASAKSNDKKERDKLKKFEKRLFAITKYRLFIIKKATFGGSRVLHKMVHLYDLIEVTPTDRSDVVELIYIDKEKGTCTARIKSDNLPTLLSTLRDLVRAISFGYSPEVTLKLNNLPSDILPAAEYEPEPGIAGGFLEVYNAQCSFYRTRPSLEFQRYVQYLVANNITDLDLTYCPGIDIKTEISVDIPTVFESLKFNTYFKAIILRNVQVKNITDSLGHAMKYNTTISRVQIVNTQEDQSLVSFGSALKTNMGNVLQVLDLSHNNFSLESVTSLCAGLVGLTHALPVLNLAHCGITAKGVHALLLAFESNFGVSLSIQELDLSYNKFDEVASSTFVTWLGHIKGAYALRKLGLAGTGIDLVVVGPVLRTIIDLHHLDLSGNKLEKPEVISELKTFIECSSELNFLNLSDCGLTSEYVEELLTQLSVNKKLQDLALNLSDNNLGIKGAVALTRAMADCNYLRSLNISRNKFKGRAIGEILTTLNSNHTLQELYIGKNLQGPADMDELTRMLLDFISCHPNMRLLDLSSSAAGKSIFPLLQALSNNTSLTSLDISGNQFGDLGASILTDSLATNATLTSINLEQNGFTLGGWQSICFALASNRTLREMPIPNSELERSVPNERKDQFRELITRLTLYLQFNASSPYPPSLPFSLPCVVPYDTPTGLTPLAHVPAHLLTYIPTKQDSVLDVLNASTSPDFKKAASPTSSPDMSPEYKYVASPTRPAQRSQTVSSFSSPPSLAPPPPLSSPPALSPRTMTYNPLPPPVSPQPPPPPSFQPPPPPSFQPPPPPSFQPPPPPSAPPATSMPLYPTFSTSTLSQSPYGSPQPPPSLVTPMDRPASVHSYPAHPTLAPPARTNLFAPPAVEEHSPPPHRAHAPSAPPAVRPPGGPPPVPPPPSSSRSGGLGSSASSPPPPPSPFGGPPPPPPPAPSAPSAPPPATKDRSAMLSDISSFSKKGLKKTVTNDRSSPKV